MIKYFIAGVFLAALVIIGTRLWKISENIENLSKSFRSVEQILEDFQRMIKPYR